MSLATGSRDLGGVAGGSTATVDSAVLGYAERILAEARELHVRAVAMNESDLVDVDPLGLILNGTFINSTALTVGHTQYRCVILKVYYNGFVFFPPGGSGERYKGRSPPEAEECDVHRRVGGPLCDNVWRRDLQCDVV